MILWRHRYSAPLGQIVRLAARQKFLCQLIPPKSGDRASTIASPQHLLLLDSEKSSLRYQPCLGFGSLYARNFNTALRTSLAVTLEPDAGSTLIDWATP